MKALDEIYKISILLHRSDLSISVTFRAASFVSYSRCHLVLFPHVVVPRCYFKYENFKNGLYVSAKFAIAMLKFDEMLSEFRDFQKMKMEMCKTFANVSKF